MIRKFAMLAVTAVALGFAAMTPASAGPGHGGHGHGHGHGHHGGHGGFHHHGHRGHHHHGWHAPRFYAGGGCLVRRVVETPWGPRVRTIDRCY